MLFEPPSFDMWCAVVDMMLRVYIGRGLSELPAALESRLVIWHRCGVPARIVASALTSVRWPGRVTLVRFYTDRRPAELRAALVG